jgi:hypothetical protein
MRPLQLILGPTFDDTAEKFEARLRPVDMMEASLVAQIVRAHWRLQLCEKLENPTSPDTERVRHHAEGSIRRNTAELRQLQADRHLNDRLNMDVPGVARVREVLQSELLARKLDVSPSTPPQLSVGDVESRIATIMTKEQELNETNLKIRSQSEGETPSVSPANSGQTARPANNSGPIGRNTPCPCGSQRKYKRCCGSGSAPKRSPDVGAGWCPLNLKSNALEQTAE